MLALLDIVVQLVSTFAGDVTNGLFSSESALIDFGIQLGRGGSNVTQCTRATCPGSFYTAIATAWANIGYLTHADVLRFINDTNFGKWAILLYIGAAITGLIGVATNSPMRNWTWFFIGPALYSFLIGTTMQVQGVNWVVANHAYPMDEVWKNAEAGLANTKLAVDGEIQITKEGPQGMYDVAMPMVFLDQLFSATTNIIIEWTGIGREVGGERNSNLSSPMGNPEGPWWLLSTLKWGMIENITASTLRDPDIRDALVTFLGSECGEAFKKGINSGAYIAASQARGAAPVATVMDKDNPGTADYNGFKGNLSKVSIPTPRAIVRLLSAPDTIGSFAYFSNQFKNQEALKNGRGTSIVCAEYLYTIVQAMRFEAGAAYYQVLRSAPNGLTREQLVRSLLYGWDVRENTGADMKSPEQEAFLKHLILTYILRNELLYAPQLTSVNQRFAPAEQSRSYSDAYVRTAGSKSKFIELYNAAVMMPYLQGILAYFLIMAYPIAAMLVVLPGHYKGFFTWVSFFAWVKLWDVGFAMVQVIERSVWAMVGNHNTMAGISRDLINTARIVGGIGVANPADSYQPPPDFVGPPDPRILESLAAIPMVCSLGAKAVDGTCSPKAAGTDQDMLDAFQLLDALLVNGAGIDLDLSNGWYIYIMSALYVAVPAVTGQLVLGAKAGSAGLIKDAFQGVGNDGGNAAKTGYQHGAVNAAMNNQSSLAQAAHAKSLRGNPHTGEQFRLKNDALNHGVNASALDNEAKAHNARAGQLAKNADMWDNARRSGADMLPSAHTNAVPWGVAATSAGRALGLQNHLPAGLRNRLSQASNLAASMNPFAPVPTGGGGTGGGGGTADSALTSDYKYAGLAGSIERHQQAGVAGSLAAGNAQRAAWDSAREGQLAQGKNAYAGNVQAAAEFEAQSAAWEAKQAFGSHVSAMAGIAGMNAGSLQAGNKPQEMTGMAMSGMLNGYSANGAKTRDVSGDASYAGFGYQDLATKTAADGNANYGWGYVDQFKPVGGLDVFTQGQGSKANMDIYSAGMAQTVSNPVDAVTSFAKDPFGTAVDPIKKAAQNFGTSFAGSASRGQTGLNFSKAGPEEKPPNK